MSKEADFISWLKKRISPEKRIINKMFETGEDLTEKEEAVIKDLVDEFAEKENLTTPEIQQLRKILNK